MLDNEVDAGESQKADHQVCTNFFNLYESDSAQVEVQTDMVGINVSVQTDATKKASRRGRVNGRATQTDMAHAAAYNADVDLVSNIESRHCSETNIDVDSLPAKGQHDANDSRIVPSGTTQHGLDPLLQSQPMQTVL